MKRPKGNTLLAYGKSFQFSIPINAQEGTLDKRSVTHVKLFLN